MFLRGEVTFADGFDGTVCLRLVFKGCSKASAGTPCKNCHNPELWSFKEENEDGGPTARLDNFKRQLKDWSETGVEFDAVTVIGGEPLDQDEAECLFLILLIKEYYPDTPFFLYTGMDEEKFFRNDKYKDHVLANNALYMKFGAYVEEIKTPESFTGRPFLGSLNQNVYKVDREGEKDIYIKIPIE